MRQRQMLDELARGKEKRGQATFPAGTCSALVVILGVSWNIGAIATGIFPCAEHTTQ